jgi:alpha-beta hydrolase superfamily lysophospholipase
MGPQLMSHGIDYSRLDHPGILGFVFYPRPDWSPPPPEATDHAVAVAEGVSVGCRFYPSGETAPSILYFHGNGEVVYDYDGIAPLYNRAGINLFVADYRGYGQSGGVPSFASTVSDAHEVFRYFSTTLRSDGYSGSLFIMGRSLGSLSAVELAASGLPQLSGLIIESGFTSAARLLAYLGVGLRSPELDDFDGASVERIRSITMPVLLIHGERDQIIPHEQAEVFYRNVGSADKRLLTIPHAGHNDLMLLGMEEYFAAVADFVSRLK